MKPISGKNDAKAVEYRLDLLLNLVLGNLRTVELKVMEVVSAEMFYKEEVYEITVGKLKKNKGMLKDGKFEEKLTKLPKLLYKIIVSSNE